MPRLAARSRGARTLCALGAAVLALGLAACGSQLDPGDVAKATGGTGGTAQGGAVIPDAGTGAVGADTTTTGGGDTATGGGTTTDGGTTAGGTTTGTGTTSGGGTTAASGSGSAGGSSGGGGGTGGGGDNAADGGSGGVSCDGFKNCLLYTSDAADE